MQTYNQIIEALDDIADAHLQINSFGHGDIMDLNSSGTINYPVMWVSPEASSLSITDKKLYLKLEIWILDMVDSDKKNDRDALSDTLLICTDIAAQLQHPSYKFYGIKKDGISLEPILDGKEDGVYGWIMGIEIRLLMQSDRCAIPMSSIDFTKYSNTELNT